MPLTDGRERAATGHVTRLPVDSRQRREYVRVRLAGYLIRAGNIQVSVRGTSLRVSPHVYNDTGDLMKLADALIELRR